MAADPTLVANTAAWLRKAGQDIERIGRCLSCEPPDLEDAVFHCQQAAEKSLKAFLTPVRACLALCVGSQALARRGSAPLDPNVIVFGPCGSLRDMGMEA